MFDAEMMPPPLDYDTLDRLRQTFASEGPIPAVQRLCDELRTTGDFGALFYALLMKKRLELGVAPFPTGPSSDLPTAVHEEYENSIREAGREVGKSYLDRNDFHRAWTFYNMLGEPQAVIDAIDRFEVSPDVDCQPIVEIALHHGVNPKKGFDLVLSRYGICSAITTVSSIDLSKKPEVFAHCVKRLIHSLYEQLQERLRSDIIARDEPDPGLVSVEKLLENRPYLMADDAYHIDVSHLSSVMQMAMQLSDGEELHKARELCRYGAGLSPSFQNFGEAPFENGYRDFEAYLDVLIGDKRDAGLAHFRSKVDALDDVDSSFPAEVFVNLLLKVDRLDEALAVAKKYLTKVPDPQLSCPGVYELCHKANDYQSMMEVARERQDGVQMLAALAKMGK